MLKQFAANPIYTHLTHSHKSPSLLWMGLVFGLTFLISLGATTLPLILHIPELRLLILPLRLVFITLSIIAPILTLTAARVTSHDLAHTEESRALLKSGLSMRTIITGLLGAIISRLWLLWVLLFGLLFSGGGTMHGTLPALAEIQNLIQYGLDALVSSSKLIGIILFTNWLGLIVGLRAGAWRGSTEAAITGVSGSLLVYQIALLAIFTPPSAKPIFPSAIKITLISLIALLSFGTLWQTAHDIIHQAE